MKDHGMLAGALLLAASRRQDFRLAPWLVEVMFWLSKRATLTVAACVLVFLAGCSTEQATPTFSLLLGGDTDFGESYHRAIRARGGKSVLDDGDYDRPLAGLASLLKGSDAVVLNLEGVLTKDRRLGLDGQKSYVHWSDPAKAPAALGRNNVTAVSLANNHAMDQGPTGLAETLSALRKNRIAPFGAGATADEASRPWVHEVAVGDHRFRLAVFAGFEYRVSYDDSLKFYAKDSAAGVNRLDTESLAADIGRIRAKEPDTFVIVFPHWGKSYETLGQIEQAVARRLVEAGADLIVGHGTHTVQATERYLGRWILYGIGNFIFGAPGRFAEREAAPFGLALRLEVTGRPEGLSKSLRVYPLLTDNLQTGYKTRPVTRAEFQAARQLLGILGQSGREDSAEMIAGQDGFGWYLQLATD